jgi:hypothetical protein
MDASAEAAHRGLEFDPSEGTSDGCPNVCITAPG